MPAVCGVMWEWLPHPLRLPFDAGSTPVAATMTEDARERRKRLDHERYMRNREERKRRQRIYYRKNIEMYLQYRKMRVINEKRKYYAILQQKEKEERQTFATV